MKRSPLRSDPEKARAWRARSKSLKRSRLSMTRRSPHADWWKVRSQVLDRDGGRCQARFADDCTGRAEHCHHIVLRSRGGSDDPHNLLGCCHRCHRAIHDAPTEATARGFMASSPRIG